MMLLLCFLNIVHHGSEKLGRMTVNHYQSFHRLVHPTGAKYYNSLLNGMELYLGFMM